MNLRLMFLSCSWLYWGALKRSYVVLFVKWRLVLFIRRNYIFFILNIKECKLYWVIGKIGDVRSVKCGFSILFCLFVKKIKDGFYRKKN